MKYVKHNKELIMKRPIMYITSGISPDQLDDTLAWAHADCIKFGSLVFKTRRLKRNFTKKLVNSLYRGKVSIIQLDEITKWICRSYIIEMYVDGED